MHNVESVRKAVVVIFLSRSWALSRFRTFGTPPGSHAADQCLALHYADIRFFADRQQIVHHVTLDRPAVSPVVWKSHLVHATAFNPQRMHAAGYEHSRFDASARRGDG